VLPLYESFGRGWQSGGGDVAGDGEFYSFQSRGILLRTSHPFVAKIEVLMLVQVISPKLVKERNRCLVLILLPQARGEIWWAVDEVSGSVMRYVSKAKYA